jgi:hypothetical protein
LFTNVTRVPGATVSVLGETPADVMVNVVPPLGVGDGVGLGVGEGVGLGAGDGAGLGAGAGAGLGVGAGEGDGLGDVPLLPPQAPTVSSAAAHTAVIVRFRIGFISRIFS